MPDKPIPQIDVEQSADGQDSDPPVAGSSGKKQKPRKRKRISWAQLPKRTLKINAELPPSSVHGTRVVFLHFARQMTFSDPSNSVTELVGHLD
ncbi:MAG: hypothetical protein RL189_2881, partial [Pseudomonadota bacterium]